MWQVREIDVCGGRAGLVRHWRWEGKSLGSKDPSYISCPCYNCALPGLGTSSYLKFHLRGGERGPVTLVAFKAIDPVLRGQGGGFDSHTLPPKTAFVRRRNSFARGSLPEPCGMIFLTTASNDKRG